MNGETVRVSSKTSSGMNAAVTTNVRYSAHRLWYQRPTASTSSTTRQDRDGPADEPDRPGAQREELLDVVDDAVPGLVVLVDHGPLDVGEHPVEDVPQLVAPRREDEDRAGDQPEDHEVKGAVDRDGAQDDLVPQRPPAHRELDLIPLGGWRRAGFAGRGTGSQASQRKQRCHLTPSTSRATRASSGRSSSASIPMSSCPRRPQTSSS